MVQVQRRQSSTKFVNLPRSLGFLIAALILGFQPLFLQAAKAAEAQHSSREPRFQIEVRSEEVSESEMKALTKRLLTRPDLEKRLKRSRYRILSSAITRPELKADVASFDSTGEGAEQFELQIYDYTNDKLINVITPVESLRQGEKVGALEESEEQVEPTEDEFARAVRILGADPRFKEALRSARVTPYRAMPPTIIPKDAGGRGNERIIPVGLEKTGRDGRHEIVAVNLSDESVERFASGSPPGAIAEAVACGPSSAGQATIRKGVSGSADITVRRGDEIIWQFNVVRPAASSGAKGSGVELRRVRYKGRLVLSRAHVPILNVNYDGGVCGPYRDWAYSENYYQASGSRIAAGILRASSVPTTIYDTNRDRGNYRGVTIYEDGPELVLLSEVSAGWYRYVSEWRLHEDGTIKPVFKFSAVYNSCTCETHHHHVYWRFDFDIDGASSNAVAVFGNGSWRPIEREAKFLRNDSNQVWRVSNPSTGFAYEVIPGPNDGTANSYGRGDVWALAYKSTELDDSRVRTATAANLDAFLSGQALTGGKDVVLWYAGHWRHDDGNEAHVDGGIAGPTLQLAR